MAERNISTRVAIEGDQKYKQALKSINEELKAVNSALLLSETRFAEEANSEAALTSKSQALMEVFRKQKEQVAALQQALANARSAQGQWASAIESTKAKLAEQTAKVNQAKATTASLKEQYASLESRYNTAKTALKALTDAGKGNTQEAKNLRAEMKQLKSEMKTTADAVKKAEEEEKKLTTEQGNLSQQLQNEQKNLETARQGTAKYATELNNAKTREQQLDAAIQKNNQYLNEARSSADRAATSIDEFGKEVKESGEEAEEMQGGMSSAAQGVETLYSALMAAGIATAIREIVNAFKECINVAGDFEYTMATVAAVSGANADEITALRNNAEQLASSTIFTAQDTADAYTVMARAGWSVDQMLDSMSGAMALSAAAGEDLDSMTTILVSSLSAFGLTAEDASYYADVLAETSADSNTNVASLGDAFSACANTCGALGYDLDDVSLALGTMANNFLQGETAGTALSTALTRMAGGNETATAALEELNISMFNSNGSARDLGDVLNELRDAFAGMTDEEKENYAYQLAGQRGMKGLLAIVNTSTDDWNELADAIANSSGAAQQMSDIQLDTYTGKVELLQSAAEALEITMGDGLKPAIERVVEALTKAINGINGFLTDHEEMVPIITGLATAFGTLVVGITAYVTVTRLAEAVMTAFSAEMSAALGPVGLIATALGLATAAFIAMSDSSDGCSEALKASAKSAKEWEQTSEELEKTAEDAQTLETDLWSLVDAADGSAASNYQIKAAVDALNNSVDGLNLEWDEETQSLNMTKEAMDAYIQSALNQAKAEAIAQRLVDLELERADLEEQLAEKQVALQTVGDGTTKGLGAQADLTKLYCGQIEDLNGALDENQNQEAELEDQMNTLTAGMEDTTDATEAVVEEFEAVPGAIDGWINGLEIGSEEWDEFTEKMESGVESLEGSLSDFWQDANEDEQVGLQDFIDNMTTSVEEMQRWTAAMQQAAEMGLDEGLLQELRDAGPESVELVEAIVNGDDAALAQLQSVYDARSKAATEAYLTQQGYTAEQIKEYWDEIEADAADGGSAATSAYAESVADGADEATDAANQISHDTSEAFADEEDLAESSGETETDAYAKGVTSEENSATTAAKKVATAAAKSMNGVRDSFYNSGRYCAQGFASGMTSCLGTVGSAAYALAQKALSEIRSAGGEGSPWKQTIKSGRFAGQGLAIGITDERMTVAKAAATVAQAAIDGADLRALTYDVSTAGTGGKVSVTNGSGTQNVNAESIQPQIINWTVNGKTAARLLGRQIGNRMAWEELAT